MSIDVDHLCKWSVQGQVEAEAGEEEVAGGEVAQAPMRPLFLEKTSTSRRACPNSTRIMSKK